MLYEYKEMIPKVLMNKEIMKVLFVSVIFIGLVLYAACSILLILTPIGSILQQIYLP